MHEKVLTSIRAFAIMETQNEEVVKMNSKKIVREIMKTRGYTFDGLAKKMGYEGANRVSERLRGTTEMRVDTLLKLISEMDCKLVIRSNLTDKAEWVVTLDELVE